MSNLFIRLARIGLHEAELVKYLLNIFAESRFHRPSRPRPKSFFIFAYDDGIPYSYGGANVCGGVPTCVMCWCSVVPMSGVEVLLCKNCCCDTNGDGSFNCSSLYVVFAAPES